MSKAVFDQLRSMSGGKLSQSQVDAGNLILKSVPDDVLLAMLGISEQNPLIINAEGFNLLRAKLFGNVITQSQFNGIERILKAINDYKLPKSQAAYVLATAYHETAHKMLPVEEIGKGKGKAYGQPIKGKAYYGRGDVQLTWLANYDKMGRLLGLDLVNNPDLALRPDVSAKIMLEGMTRGLFTGKSLNDYITPAKIDYVAARRIINGTDRAELIAGYARIFEQAFEGKP